MRASIEIGANGQMEDISFWQALQGNGHRPKLLDLAYDMAERGVRETDPTEGRGQVWRLRLHTLQCLRGGTGTHKSMVDLLRTEMVAGFVRFNGSARELGMVMSSWGYAG